MPNQNPGWRQSAVNSGVRTSMPREEQNPTMMGNAMSSREMNNTFHHPHDACSSASFRLVTMARSQKLAAPQVYMPRTPPSGAAESSDQQPKMKTIVPW